jgi:hypothetical protein
VRRWKILGIVLSVSLGASQPVFAEPNVAALTKSPYKYPIHTQAGTFLICLKSYKGPEAQGLAEELAEYVRSSYGLPAYLLEVGSELRKAEEKRIAELKKQYQEMVEKMGADNVAPLKIKTHRIDPEYAVFIGGSKGGWKDDETALKYLKELRKKPAPPEKLLDKAVGATNADPKSKSYDPKYMAINPFKSAFVSRNPALPSIKRDDDKPDPFLKDLNAGEKYSLLKTSKAWTLVVKGYTGSTVVKDQDTDTSLLEKLMGGKLGSQMSASAMQAHELAKYLRSMKPSYNAYVLHTRYSSIVCVGEYDSMDDPQLLENARTLANLRIGSVDQLLATPGPMKIPRP